MANFINMSIFHLDAYSTPGILTSAVCGGAILLWLYFKRYPRLRAKGLIYDEQSAAVGEKNEVCFSFKAEPNSFRWRLARNYSQLNEALFVSLQSPNTSRRRNLPQNVLGESVGFEWPETIWGFMERGVKISGKVKLVNVLMI